MPKNVLGHVQRSQTSFKTTLRLDDYFKERISWASSLPGFWTMWMKLLWKRQGLWGALLCTWKTVIKTNRTPKESLHRRGLWHLCRNVQQKHNITFERPNPQSVYPWTPWSTTVIIILQISSALDQFIAAPNSAPENATELVFNLAENVITLLWCLSWVLCSFSTCLLIWEVQRDIEQGFERDQRATPRTLPHGIPRKPRQDFVSDSCSSRCVFVYSWL